MMDELTAFERQIGAELRREIGVVPSFDAMAIARTTATQSPKWRFQSMFSATKFLVAAAVVALFGGFLLAGVLTQPSEESVPAAGASASASVQPTSETTSDSEAGPDGDAAEGDAAEQAGLTSSAGTFSLVESLAGAGSFYSGTLLQDGRVLLVDATHGEVWDPATGSLSPAGIMSAPRADHSAERLADGRVLVVGGDDSAGPSTEVWDPATSSFGQAGSLAEWGNGSYFRPSTTLLQDGRVLVTGGGTHHTDSTQVVVAWDPQTGTSTVVGTMIENRAEQTATLLQDGRVLIVGGEVEPGDPSDGICTACDTPTALAEVWDPETETFSPAGSLSEGRAQHTATLLPDGRVLVIGGGDTYDYETPSAEIWDPETETFSPAGALTEARARHTATLLPDGRVLVIGGSSNSDRMFPSAEIWDPATMSFSPAGSMISPRRWHSATLLPDGRVLVTSGSANAEIWEPVTDEPPADSAATPDLLPGVDLVTEEVEPGVYRVINDEVRDVADLDGTGVVAGLDGSVWLYVDHAGGGISYRLGEPAALTARIDAVGMDGTVWDIEWADEHGSLRSFDGEQWTVHDLRDPEQVEVLADGSVWAKGFIFDPWIERLGPDGWEAVPAPTGLEDLITSASGEFLDLDLITSASGEFLYLVGDESVWTPDPDGGWTRLARFEDIWPEPGYAEFRGPVVVGDDGTVWTTAYIRGPGPRQVLARFDGSEWTTFEPPEGSGVNARELGQMRLQGVAPDGAAWMAGNVLECWGEGPGVIGSDGTRWSQHFDSRCATAFDISPDGAVWVQVGGDTYVITPEAVAGTE